MSSNKYLQKSRGGNNNNNNNNGRNNNGRNNNGSSTPRIENSVNTGNTDMDGPTAEQLAHLDNGRNNNGRNNNGSSIPRSENSVNTAEQLAHLDNGRNNNGSSTPRSVNSVNSVNTCSTDWGGPTDEQLAHLDGPTAEQQAHLDNWNKPNGLSFVKQNDRVLGKGDQGSVQKITLTETLILNNGATVLESGEDMAIKFIKKSNFEMNENGLLDFTESKEALEREYLLLSPLLRNCNYSHKNIMNIYNYYNYPMENGDEIVFILLEYLNGESLETEFKEIEENDFIIDTNIAGGKKIRLRNFNSFSGDVSLNIDDFKNIFIQCIRGLKYLHTNEIIHRDIKPDNIMICRNAGGVTAKIIDFGHACKISDDQENTCSCKPDIYGTPLYILNNRSFDRKYLDIYSLAIIGLRYFFPGIINPRYTRGEYLDLFDVFKLRLLAEDSGNFNIFSIYDESEFLERITPLIKLIIEMLSKDRNLIINPDNPLNSVNANGILFKQVNVPGNAAANAPAIVPGNVPVNAHENENDGGANAPPIKNTNVRSGGKKTYF